MIYKALILRQLTYLIKIKQTKPDSFIIHHL